MPVSVAGPTALEHPQCVHVGARLGSGTNCQTVEHPQCVHVGARLIAGQTVENPQCVHVGARLIAGQTVENPQCVHVGAHLGSRTNCGAPSVCSCRCPSR